MKLKQGITNILGTHLFLEYAISYENIYLLEGHAW